MEGGGKKREKKEGREESARVKTTTRQDERTRDDAKRERARGRKVGWGVVADQKKYRLRLISSSRPSLEREDMRV